MKMKKIMVVVLALAMMCAFTACGGSGESDDVQGDEAESTGVANPMVEYGSLEEIADAVQCEMPPCIAEDVSDEAYFVIDDSVAQYDFTTGGVEYTLRSTYDYSQINLCGIYINAEPAIPGEVTGELNYVTSDECKIASWCTMDGQYSFVAQDGGSLDQSAFEEITEYFYEETSLWMTDAELEEIYKGFEGSYQDSYSQRAVADMTADGSNGLKVLVSWGNSAMETVQWEMTLKVTEDGLMSYSDCEKSIHTFTDDGEETVSVEYTDGEGYFIVTNGAFAWEGAAEESCVDCVFEK